MMAGEESDEALIEALAIVRDRINEATKRLDDEIKIATLLVAIAQQRGVPLEAAILKAEGQS